MPSRPCVEEIPLVSSRDLSADFVIDAPGRRAPQTLLFFSSTPNFFIVLIEYPLFRCLSCWVNMACFVNFEFSSTLHSIVEWRSIWNRGPWTNFLPKLLLHYCSLCASTGHRCLHQEGVRQEVQPDLALHRRPQLRLIRHARDSPLHLFLSRPGRHPAVQERLSSRRAAHHLHTQHTKQQQTRSIKFTNILLLLHVRTTRYPNPPVRAPISSQFPFLLHFSFRELGEKISNKIRLWDDNLTQTSNKLISSANNSISPK